jgi:hypothetical protein
MVLEALGKRVGESRKVTEAHDGEPSPLSRLAGTCRPGDSQAAPETPWSTGGIDSAGYPCGRVRRADNSFSNCGKSL